MSPTHINMLSLLLFLFSCLFCAVSSETLCRSFQVKCTQTGQRLVVGNPLKVCSAAECTSAECSCITAVGKCADFKTAECGSGYTIKSPLPETECKSGQCTITQCCDASPTVSSTSCEKFNCSKIGKTVGNPEFARQRCALLTSVLA